MPVMRRSYLLIAFAPLLAQLPSHYKQTLPADVRQRFEGFSKRMEDTGLAEPFRGVTATGTVEPGLFAVKSTGVSTEPVRKAAEAFLKVLSADQKARTSFAAADDVEWRKWANQHPYLRAGVGFNEMTEAQREAAFGLLRSSLSANGLKLTRDIMKLNYTLGELNNNNFVEYGEWLYWITIMGKPSAKEPWGWQLDGHHCVINYFVLGDQVVMTPSFFGSEPVVARSGKYNGTAILREEQDKGFEFFRSLDDAQRGKAVLNRGKDRNYNLTEAFKDNVVLDYAGLQGSELAKPQQEALLRLVGLYVGNMDDGHARARMDEVRRHIGKTWFSWVGGSEPGGVFYYRIHSPVILIEFDHQMPVGLRHLAANPKAPDREHVHAIIRTPNGNDYGKDLLRQHYAAHRHSD